MIIVEYTDAQLDLIKNTYAKGATDDEFQMFISYCISHDLDPENKEIDFVKYPIKLKGVPTGKYTVSFQPAVKGLMKKARRQPDFRGLVACAVRKNDHFEADIANHKITHTFSSHNRGGLVGAWAKLYREGMQPFIKYILLEDFFKDNSFWKNFGTDMTEKTAKKKVLNEAYGLDDVYLEGVEKPVSGLLAEPVIPDLLPEGPSHPPEFYEGKKEDMAAVVEDFSKESYDLAIAPLPKKTTVKEQVKAAEKEHFAAAGQPEPTAPVFSFDEPAKKTIVLRDKDPVKQLDADIDNMIQEEDLDIFETLSAKTQEQFGDDWYGSMTAKTKESQDVPLHFLRHLVDTTVPEANVVEELYQERLKSKKRTITLLDLYHNSLMDYFETNHKPLPILTPSFIAKMDLILRRFIDLDYADLNIEQIYQKVQEETDWKDDWVTWAVAYLKKRKLI